MTPRQMEKIGQLKNGQQVEQQTGGQLALGQVVLCQLHIDQVRRRLYRGKSAPSIGPQLRPLRAKPHSWASEKVVIAKLESVNPKSLVLLR